MMIAVGAFGGLNFTDCESTVPILRRKTAAEQTKAPNETETKKNRPISDDGAKPRQTRCFAETATGGIQAIKSAV